MDDKISTRIDMAIAFLKKEHIIRFQKEVAERMGVDVNTVSRAKNGGEYNAESFAMRFNAAFNFMFSNEWLIHGIGSMLSSSGKTDSIPPHPSVIHPNKVNNEIPSWADSLIQLVSDNIGATEALRRENASLTSALNEIIDENKKLGALLDAAISEIHTIRRRATITQHYNLASEESLPIAAENM